MALGSACHGGEGVSAGCAGSEMDRQSVGAGVEDPKCHLQHHRNRLGIRRCGVIRQHGGGQRAREAGGSRVRLRRRPARKLGAPAGVLLRRAAVVTSSPKLPQPGRATWCDRNDRLGPVVRSGGRSWGETAAGRAPRPGLGASGRTSAGVELRRVRPGGPSGRGRAGRPCSRTPVTISYRFSTMNESGGQIVLEEACRRGTGRRPR